MSHTYHDLGGTASQQIIESTIEHAHRGERLLAGVALVAGDKVDVVGDVAHLEGDMATELLVAVDRLEHATTTTTTLRVVRTLPTHCAVRARLVVLLRAVAVAVAVASCCRSIVRLAHHPQHCFHRLGGGLRATSIVDRGHVE